MEITYVITLISDVYAFCILAPFPFRPLSQLSVPHLQPIRTLYSNKITGYV